MEKIYKVKLTEEAQYEIEVEADSESQAQERVTKYYRDHGSKGAEFMKLSGGMQLSWPEKVKDATDDIVDRVKKAAKRIEQELGEEVHVIVIR